MLNQVHVNPAIPCQIMPIIVPREVVYCGKEHMVNSYQPSTVLQKNFKKEQTRP